MTRSLSLQPKAFAEDVLPVISKIDLLLFSEGFLDSSMLCCPICLQAIMRYEHRTQNKTYLEHNILILARNYDARSNRDRTSLVELETCLQISSVTLRDAQSNEHTMASANSMPSCFAIFAMPLSKHTSQDSTTKDTCTDKEDERLQRATYVVQRGPSFRMQSAALCPTQT